MNIESIHQEALHAAKEAEQEFLLKHGELAYCGFAWVSVEVSRTNSKEAKALSKVGFQPGWIPKRMILWNVTGSGTQSMSVKEYGARAYAEVLRNNGLQASMQSRPD
jgi:hypothetical protein